MIHVMHLNDVPFNKIVKGEKQIEIRLNDEKRQIIRIGDEIVFVRLRDERSCAVEVLALHKFKTFRELFESDLFPKCGCVGMNAVDAEQSMYRYYSEEEVKKYGVLAIEVGDSAELRMICSDIKDAYEDCNIPEEDIANFARRLWRNFIVEKDDLNEILSETFSFEENMRDGGAAIEIGRQCAIYNIIISNLKPNSENAARLYKSFLEYRNLYAFTYLMDECSEYITAEQRKNLLDIAQKTFIRSVWEKYI